MVAHHGLTYTAGMDGESLPIARNGGLRFLKMHGLGNDFVVIDQRAAPGRRITPELVRALGDRHRGVGFDTLALLGVDDSGAPKLSFYNSDGSEAAACGNATRCVARLIFEETGSTEITLRTPHGELVATDAGARQIRVNMGRPQDGWREIPLARDMPADPLPLPGAPAAVGMGNPHCVFVVPDAEAVDLTDLGSRIEHDPIFPEHTNVEIVEVIDRWTLRMRVWERGGMITQACGSGACAAAVVAASRNLAERRVTVRLDGGELEIDWRPDGVWMTGPASRVFEGTLEREFLEGLG